MSHSDVEETVGMVVPCIYSSFCGLLSVLRVLFFK